jgi:peptidyl-dipeptidase A
MGKSFFYIGLLFVLVGCLNEKQQAEKILRHYISQKEDLIRNYSMESSTALWNATVSGDENDYQKLVDIELAFNKSNQNESNHFAPDRFYSISQNVFTNEQDFQLLKKLKYSGLITDTLLSRQLNVLYQAFMGPQIETERYQKLMSAEVKLWQSFSTLKISIKGKMYGGSQIDSIRKNTTDASVLKSIFEAYQNQGRLLAPDIIRMVKERNEFARNFGYSDFYELSLEAKDQTPEQIKLLLDDIELNTRKQFFEAKSVIDKLLAKRFQIETDKLKPWHYHEERNSYLPEKFTAKMDSLFLNTDPIKQAEKFFSGIGLPIDDVVKNSDLEYRRSKSAVTAMINVDFKNDIRLISSIQNTHEGMIRMMHLGGHASHYKTISDSVPYLLKTPNYALGEGVARYFESLASNFEWLKDALIIDTTAQRELILVCQHLHQVDRLFRCRKLLAMADFEREVYKNPNQNLDQLWQKLNLKYLGIDFADEKNSCFWAANKYATSLSCTTHNLVLADVFAAQLQHTIEKRVLTKTGSGYANNTEIGKFLTENLYRYGNELPWEKLIERVTGEPLNTSYFVGYLVGDEYGDKNK